MTILCASSGPGSQSADSTTQRREVYGQAVRCSRISHGEVVGRDGELIQDGRRAQSGQSALLTRRPGVSLRELPHVCDTGERPVQR